MALIALVDLMTLVDFMGLVGPVSLVGPVGVVGVNAKGAKVDVHFGPAYATVHTPDDPLFIHCLDIFLS